ncbi:MAG: hypothetical protein Tsb002_33780 [Wenzhouxiangellaceae bacterium]
MLVSKSTQYQLTILTSALLLVASSVANAQSSTGAFATDTAIETVPKTTTSSIVVLSDSMGDAGYEMMLSNATRLSDDELQQHSNVIMIYGDIDSLKANKNTFGIIDQALVRGLPVVLESRHWNVQALHAFTRKYDPDINLEGLQNVAIELTYRDDGTVWAVDTTPSEVAVMAGVPYEKTSESKAYVQLHTSTLAPIHPAAPFAAAAIIDNPGHIGSYILERDRDIYKFWRAHWSGRNYCVVGVRGHTDIERWLRIKDIFTVTLVTPYEGYSGNARIDRDWRLRTDNISLGIRASAYELGCDTINFTAHSLGAPVAINLAFSLYSFIGNTFIDEVVGFNSPRVGNRAYRNELHQRLYFDPLHFCRSSDPIWPVPYGLEHYANGPDGCTYLAPPTTTHPNDLFLNHSMDLWL